MKRLIAVLMTCLLALMLMVSVSAEYAASDKQTDVMKLKGTDTIAAADALENREIDSPIYAYEAVAQELYTIGILRGDGAAFNLDRIPDRLQACVMVVRMRGEEDAALAAYEAGEITCPFTDISENESWAKPYLAWLYDKRITLGIGDGKFGNGDCSAQMYVTFMLRALGYTDVSVTEETVDFTFDDALSFAYEKELWNTSFGEGAFCRGTMAAVTYQTLAAACKASDISLLTTLVNSGAVDKDAAAPIVEKMRAYSAVRTAVAQLNPDQEKPTAIQTKAEMEKKIVSLLVTDGESGDVAAKIILTDTVASIVYGDDIQACVTGTLTIDGKQSEIGIWYKDGTVYTDILGKKTKETDAEPDIFSLFDLSAVAIPPCCGVGSADGMINEDGSYTCTFDVSDYLYPLMLHEFNVNVHEADADTKEIFNLKISITYDADGNVSDYGFSGIMLIVRDCGDQEVFSRQYTLSYRMYPENAGDVIAVSYPVLTDFSENKE